MGILRGWLKTRNRDFELSPILIRLYSYYKSTHKQSAAQTHPQSCARSRMTAPSPRGSLFLAYTYVVHTEIGSNHKTVHYIVKRCFSKRKKISVKRSVCNVNKVQTKNKGSLVVRELSAKLTEGGFEPHLSLYPFLVRDDVLTGCNNYY